MTRNTVDLTGRTALVTGAGRGLGWGIAVALARAGARVCISDIDADNVHRAVATVEEEGGTAMGVPFDVADRAAFEHAVGLVVERWGRLDAMVHAAIYMPLERFADTSDEDWRRQLDVGLGGFYNGVRASWAPMVRQGGGHLIGIASGSSVRGYVDEVPYCTLKHALEGFVKSLALEAVDAGLALNTVGPGAPIKPTRLTWDELASTPAEVRAGWADPRDLGRAFAWLTAQEPTSWTGLRFDAGPIRDCLDREGAAFEVTPERVTLYPDDFRARQAWCRDYASVAS